jgi:hypothetical protein
MNKRLLLISLAFIITLAEYPSAYAQQKKKEAVPPRKLEYDNKTFKTLPVWQDSNTYLEADLDDEPGYEVILGFIATYKPESEEVEEDKVPFAITKKKEIVPVENHAFYQIYKKTLDGRFHAVKTISGMDQLGKVEVINLDTQGHKALAIFSLGGEHYTDLSIYLWKDGGYRLVFNEGSSQAITIDAQQKPARIRINASDDKKKTFVWDQNRDGFKQIEF